MSECNETRVLDPKCPNCIHNNICIDTNKHHNYLKELNKVNENQDFSHFSVEVYCINFRYNTPQPRTPIF